MNQAIRCALIVALWAAAGTALAQGDTLLQFNSESGDYVGGGLHFTLTPSDGTITASRVDGGVAVGFSSDDSTWWTLHFVPPSGATLTPGAYEGVTRWPFQAPTTGGLDVSGNGRGCNTLIGRFTVLEAEFAGDGEILNLAVDYEQHCEGDVPALFGSVRYNSGVPLGPRLAVGPAWRYEGDVGWSTLAFIVSLSGPADTAVTVHYQSSDGTALAGSDYSAVSGTATIPVGETIAIVALPLLGDVAEEGDETLTLLLSEASGAPIAFGAGLGTILNDDPDKTYLHFDSEPGDWVGLGQQFTLTPVEGNITLEQVGSAVHAAFDGSTDWGLSFAPPTGEILTPGSYEGATRYPFQSPTTPGLDVSGDGRGCGMVDGRFVVLEAEYGAGGEVLRFAADYEQHCHLEVPALFGSVRYRSSMPRGPRVSVGPARVYEGDNGSSNMGFVISLSAPADAAVTVDYETVDGTATAGSDYTHVSGTATFAPGETAVPVPVPVHGDLMEEGDEAFTLSLSNATGAPIAFGEGDGSILDDDPYKTLLYFNSEPGDWVGAGHRFTRTPAGGTFVAERVDGGVHIAYASTLWWDLHFIPPTGQPLAPGDYLGATGWNYGSSTTPLMRVEGEGRGCSLLIGKFTVLEAEYGAGGEVLRLAIDYEQHCDGATAALFGWVRYNSSVPVVPRLAVNSVSRYEADDGSWNLNFEISLPAPADTVVTVDYQVVDVTATAGSDYTAASGTATFPVGTTKLTVPVTVFGDTVQEDDETLAFVLSNSAGAPIGFGHGVGTILNDDPYKTFLYFNSEPGDWIGGGSQFTLTWEDGTITAESFERGVHVHFNGSTWWDLYFVPISGVALKPGVYLGATRPGYPDRTTPGLDVSGDGRGCNMLTGRYTILELEYGTDGKILRFAADYEQHCEGGDPALYGSVRYRSGVPRVRRAWVAGSSVAEGDSGTASLDFPVWLSEPSSSPVTVSFATEDGTASQGVDYTPLSGSMVLPAGETNGVIQVSVLGDNSVEEDESFSLNLVGAEGAVAGPPSGATATIRNDDADGPMGFHTLQPCRLLDSREIGPALAVDVERVVAAAGACGIPPEARTVILNVTAVAPTGTGHIQAYAAGTAAPGTSVLSFSGGRTRAGLAFVRLGANGAFTLMCRMPGSPGGTTHAVIDVSGYFR